MTEWNAGKIRVSIKDDEHGEYSLLITGEADNSVHLVWRLSELGVKARTMGRIVVASGKVLRNDDGTFAEFGATCNHQTVQDATRHAVHRLSDVLREHQVVMEVGEESSIRGFTPQSSIFERFTFGPGLA